MDVGTHLDFNSFIDYVDPPTYSSLWTKRFIEIYLYIYLNRFCMFTIKKCSALSNKYSFLIDINLKVYN